MHLVEFSKKLVEISTYSTGRKFSPVKNARSKQIFCKKSICKLSLSTKGKDWRRQLDYACYLFSSDIPLSVLFHTVRLKAE